jgi:hypothetical protein
MAAPESGALAPTSIRERTAGMIMLTLGSPRLQVDLAAHL